MSNNTDEPKAPGQPSIREDGTVDANGVDLGQIDGWKSSESPYEGQFTERHPEDCDCSDCE